jgi:hypothetical protein
VSDRKKRPSALFILSYMGVSLGLMTLGVAFLGFDIYRDIGVSKESIQSRFAEITDELGINDLQMVITDGKDNCGGAGGGCFHRDDLNVIYVSPEVKHHYLDFVIVHEIGHALDARAGRETSECSADQFAKDFGVLAVMLSPYKCDLK